MKRLIFILMSVLPGVSVAQHLDMKSRVRFTLKEPADLIETVSVIEEVNHDYDESKLEFTLDRKKKTIEVTVKRESKADDLVKSLKEIFGENVIVQKVVPGQMMHGTQDDMMR